MSTKPAGDDVSTEGSTASTARSATRDHEKDVVCLFAYARDKQMTGTLELARPGEPVSVRAYLEGGTVAKIRTTTPVAFLANVLYELGYVDPKELTASLFELAKRERLHGEILLSNGHITREQLAHALHEQTSRKLDHALTLGKVSFEFHPEVDRLEGYGGKERVPVEPLPAIWRSVRETPPMDHLRASLTRVGDLPCRLVADDSLARLKLAPEELALAEHLRHDELSLEDLCALGLLPRKRTELVFYCLLITKQIEGGAPPSSRPVPPSNRTERRTWTWRGGSSILPQSPSSAPPSSPRVGPPSSGSMPVAGSAAKSLKLGGAGGVFERARSILREDHFERLGISVDATPPEIERAFLEVVELWSPPAPPQVAGAQEAQETVLTAIVEAYETLTDAMRRDDYMRALVLTRGRGPTTR